MEFNRKQQQVQQPLQIGLPEVLQPYSYSMCVRARARARARACVFVCETGLGFVYILLYTNYIQVTRNPFSLMHLSVQGNTELCFRMKN